MPSFLPIMIWLWCLNACFLGCATESPPKSNTRSATNVSTHSNQHNHNIARSESENSSPPEASQDHQSQDIQSSPIPRRKKDDPKTQEMQQEQDESKEDSINSDKDTGSHLPSPPVTTTIDKSISNQCPKLPTFSEMSINQELAASLDIPLDLEDEQGHVVGKMNIQMGLVHMEGITIFDSNKQVLARGKMTSFFRGMFTSADLFNCNDVKIGSVDFEPSWDSIEGNILDLNKSKVGHISIDVEHFGASKLTLSSEQNKLVTGEETLFSLLPKWQLSWMNHRIHAADGDESLSQESLLVIIGLALKAYYDKGL